ncbi:MAG: hypothetical protein KVP17_000490 [Porospora cf. gigantea B]|uniref:uncharacterized protein n=2 Tax=Porospora cf. gigantea B TaxID=2853592 RepID=UPI00357189EF|nr:MAG: hypothetical protein KVP17_000490 [Porospora cf. gigantea B]
MSPERSAEAGRDRTGLLPPGVYDLISAPSISSEIDVPQSLWSMLRVQQPPSRERPLLLESDDSFTDDVTVPPLRPRALRPPRGSWLSDLFRMEPQSPLEKFAIKKGKIECLRKFKTPQPAFVTAVARDSQDSEQYMLVSQQITLEITPPSSSLTMTTGSGKRVTLVLDETQQPAFSVFSHLAFLRPYCDPYERFRGHNYVVAYARNLRFPLVAEMDEICSFYDLLRLLRDFHISLKKRLGYLKSPPSTMCSSSTEVDL